MRTRILTVDPHHPDEAVLQTAADALKAGGLVAFPTETVYGIGADALNEAAVARIFAAKGRPADNPLIVHVAASRDVTALAVLTEEAQRRLDALVRRYWPGPLTIIVPKSEDVPDGVSAGLATVALRMPDHPVALALIRAAGRPVAAPSANRSGRPSPTEAGHVERDLGGRIDVLLDGGPATIGLESTVLDLSVDPPAVHRPGAISAAQLAHTLQTPVHIADGADFTGSTDQPPHVRMRLGSTPPSPGVKYEHYAPRTPCVLLEGNRERVEAALHSALRMDRRAGKRTAVLATEESAALFRAAADAVCVAGPHDDYDAIAHNIYRCLRRLDDAAADIIYIQGVASEGLGEAIMNRLRRAAGHRVEHVR